MNVDISNQFGEQTLRLGRAKHLCVPSVKNDEGLLTDIEDVLDHFKCYNVNKDQSTRLHPAPPIVTLIDQFTVENVEPGRKPDFFCNPVSKDGSPFLNEMAHLSCYGIDGNGGDDDDDSDDDNAGVDVDISNQFGEQTLALRRAKRLCVPSEKLSVEPVPPSSDDDDDD